MLVILGKWIKTIALTNTLKGSPPPLPAKAPHPMDPACMSSPCVPSPLCPEQTAPLTNPSIFQSLQCLRGYICMGLVLCTHRVGLHLQNHPVREYCQSPLFGDETVSSNSKTWHWPLCLFLFIFFISLYLTYT